MIERQQQTILELSGRWGYYQNEIQHLKERIALLEAPNVTATVTSAESETPDTPDVRNCAQTPDPAPTSTAYRSAHPQNGPSLDYSPTGAMSDVASSVG